MMVFVVIDEDLGLKEAERTVEESFAMIPLTRKSSKGHGSSFCSCKFKLMTFLISYIRLVITFIYPTGRKIFLLIPFFVELLCM